MGFLNKLFNGADGTRETMKEIYLKQIEVLKQQNVELEDIHGMGLYGALASRYIARGNPQPEVVIFSELAPFLAMEQADAVDMLAEYIVYKELPDKANSDLLRRQINDALCNEYENTGKSSVYGGIANTAAWCLLLEPYTISKLQLIK